MRIIIETVTAMMVNTATITEPITRPTPPWPLVPPQTLNLKKIRNWSSLRNVRPHLASQSLTVLLDVNTPLSRETGELQEAFLLAQEVTLLCKGDTI